MRVRAALLVAVFVLLAVGIGVLVKGTSNEGTPSVSPSSSQLSPGPSLSSSEFASPIPPGLPFASPSGAVAQGSPSAAPSGTQTSPAAQGTPSPAVSPPTPSPSPSSPSGSPTDTARTGTSPAVPYLGAILLMVGVLAGLALRTPYTRDASRS